MRSSIGNRQPERCYQVALSEADVQRTCVDFMIAERWEAIRTDPCSDRARGKGFGAKGMADHLFIRYGVGIGTDTVLWVEFKRPAGVDARGRRYAAGKASQTQLGWHALARQAGARTAIAGVDFEPTFEGFKAWYLEQGYEWRSGR
jgi:hypothetical protein